MSISATWTDLGLSSAFGSILCSCFCIAVIEKRECHNRKWDFVNGSKFRERHRRVQRLVDCPAAYIHLFNCHTFQNYFTTGPKKDTRYAPITRAPQRIPPDPYKQKAPRNTA